MSQATTSGRCPCRFSRFASFAMLVVFPEPCRPTTISTVGGRGAVSSFGASPPRPPPSTLDPRRAPPPHLEVHVRLEHRHAHFAKGLVQVLLGYDALAAELLERALELVCQALKHALPRRQSPGGRTYQPAQNSFPTVY